MFYCGAQGMRKYEYHCNSSGKTTPLCLSKISCHCYLLASKNSAFLSIVGFTAKYTKYGQSLRGPVPPKSLRCTFIFNSLCFEFVENLRISADSTKPAASRELQRWMIKRWLGFHSDSRYVSQRAAMSEAIPILKWDSRLPRTQFIRCTVDRNWTPSDKFVLLPYWWK